MDKPHHSYTWLFFVPSSKQVVDREESKTIFGVRQTNSNKRRVLKDTLQSALLLLLRRNYFAVSYKTSRYLESLHLRTVSPWVYMLVAGPILLSLKGV
jgi:hypothetical protein